MRLLQAELSCESYESSSVADLWQKESEQGQERQGGEAQVRVFSLSLEDYGSRAVCKDSPAWMQLPWLLGGKRCTQLSEECACDDGACDRGIRILGEHLSLLINQVVQRLPLYSRV